jgi:hypothetical protein
MNRVVLAAHLRRRAMAMALDQPVLVVGLLPSNERQAKLLDRVEGTHPNRSYRRLGQAARY